MKRRALAIFLVAAATAHAGGPAVRVTLDAAVPETTARVTATLAGAGTVHLRWSVVAAEELPADSILLDQDQTLQAGKPLEATLDAPAVGLAPGTYRLDVTSAAGTTLGSATFKVTASPPAEAGAARQGDGANLAAAAHGGQVRGVTSQADAGDASAANLIDGPAGKGWTAAGNGPDDILFSFYGERLATVGAVVIEAGEHPDKLARRVEVWTSALGLADGFTRVAAVRLAPTPGAQRIALPPTPARYLRLHLVARDQGLEAGEVAILEAKGPSILRDLPRRLEPAGDDDPVPVLDDRAAPEDLARARPVRLDHVTPLRREGTVQWFRLAVAASGPSVLHIGTQNTHGNQIRVYDAGGTVLLAHAPPLDRASRWHGRVAPGRYYVRLDWAEGSEPEPATTPPGAEPGLIVIQGRVEAEPTPAGAAQLGLDYLQIDTPAWQQHNQCFGCHVQAETLMGMTIARKHSYRVLDPVAVGLGEFVVDHGHHDTDVRELFRQTALRYYVEGFAPARAEAAESLASAAFSAPPERWELETGGRLPVEGSSITSGAMAVQILTPLLKTASAKARPGFQEAREGVLAYLQGATPTTVQDRVMRLIAYTEAGVAPGAIDAEVKALLAMQNGDGGFGETEGGGPSNAYGTGQALYGLKIAGFPIADPRFGKAVVWLMARQRRDGSWPELATKSTTEIAHTMWPVIGLAGAIDKAQPGTTDPVMLVPLRLLARDARNQGLADLGLADFSVKEDGKPQEVVDLYRELGDLSIVLVMDNSGSIARSLPTSVAAARGFLELLGKDDRVSVLAFSDKPQPATPFTTDRAATAAALAAMRARGGTALYDAVGGALEALADAPEPRAVVLLTDGKDEDGPGRGPGSKATLPQTLERLRAAGIPVFTIGLGAHLDHRVLDDIAGASGGTATYVASDEGLAAIYHQLASALQARWVLIFRSSRPVADGGWRRVEVGTTHPGARIQAPAGYAATADLLQ